MGRSRGGIRRTVAAVATGALLLGIPAVAQAQSGQGGGGGSGGRCRPGAPGIGDDYYPTYGNGGYDVRHYDLDITYDPATDQLDGDATLDVVATQSLCSFDLDLVGLTVRSIEVDGRAARWTRDGQELVVTPARALRRGRHFEVAVEYDGVPVEFTLPGYDVRTGWMTTPDGVTVAGQPEASTAWYPVNDHPLDKATYDFTVTVPDGYEVVANGNPRGHRSRRGWTTWRWDPTEPMASYLATIDIGHWDLTRDRTESGLPVYDAVDSAITGELREVIDAGLARQGEIVDFLSEAFGEYPFDTVGAIVPNQDDLFFALETQTRPVYGKVFWIDAEGNPERADWVIVHELAHQWFGDDVALARWQDIWLNEGFATYAEWLWREREDGTPVDEWFQAVYESYPADDPFWTVPPGDPGVEDLFSGAVYDRGAMTLQALRREVGDEAFWRIVRGWYASKSGGNGTTAEFVALAERVSGQQLDDLFQTWLFTPSRPALEPAAAAAASTPSASASAAATATPAVSDELRAQAAASRADLERRLQSGAY